METAADNTKLSQKLTGPIAAIIEKHKGELLPLMLDKSATLSHAALKNDAVVHTVATYCYRLLPGLVRFAVKEATFISFVMSNREKLLGRLLAAQEQEKSNDLAALAIGGGSVSGSVGHLPQLDQSIK